MTNPPIIDYGPHRRSESRKKASVVYWVAFLVVVGALGRTALVWIRHSDRQPTYPVHCASNLRQIGQAIHLYAADNAGAFPPDLQTVLATQQISAEVFNCPSSSDTKANALSALAQPGHCAYIYVGAGLNVRSDPNRILALEDPANHDSENISVLYADGHVEWQSLPIVMQTLNDLAIGKNPPSTSTTFSESAAKKDYEKNWKSRMPLLKSGVWPIPTTQPASP